MKPKKVLWVLFIFMELTMNLAYYPWVSSTYNSYLQSQEINSIVGNETTFDFESVYRGGVGYNNHLKPIVINGITVNESVFSDEYREALVFPGTEAISRVTVPKADIDLPIYKGTMNSILEKGAGHLYGTHLPVGGEGTNSVITAHSGLPGANMFNNLTVMDLGDEFFLTTANKALKYKVVHKEVEPPDAAGELVKPQKGKDLATLITCTPYAVNTHRLVLVGERVPFDEKEAKELVQQNGGMETPWWVVTYIPLQIALISYHMRSLRKLDKKTEQKEESK